MTTLLLREGLPPDDAVVVVRGGEMNSDFVRRTATRSFEEVGVSTVSVFLAVEESVEELCRSVEDLERYGTVRLSTVGRLRSLRFALLSDARRAALRRLAPRCGDGDVGSARVGVRSTRSQSSAATLAFPHGVGTSGSTTTVGTVRG